MTPETERILLATLRRIERNTLIIEAQEIDIMMTQAELAAALTAVSDQLAKATNEIVAALAAAGGTTPAVDAAVARLRAAAQALDDMNPDTP
jgi:hypothetical protein